MPPKRANKKSKAANAKPACTTSKNAKFLVKEDDVDLNTITKSIEPAQNCVASKGKQGKDVMKTSGNGIHRRHTNETSSNYNEMPGLIEAFKELGNEIKTKKPSLADYKLKGLAGVRNPTKAYDLILNDMLAEKELKFGQSEIASPNKNFLGFPPLKFENVEPGSMEERYMNFVGILKSENLLAPLYLAKTSLPETQKQNLPEDSASDNVPSAANNHQNLLSTSKISDSTTQTRKNLNRNAYRSVSSFSG